MEITRREYHKAFMNALEAEMKELQEHEADNMMSMIISLCVAGTVRKMEVALFGEEDPKDAGNED